MIIGICGSGVMGSGIATACIQAGHTAILYDINDFANTRAIDYINLQLSKAVERGKMKQEEVDAALAFLRSTTTLDSFVECDFVIEAIIENKEVKQDLFGLLEAIIPETTILGTNTSSIAITTLASSLNRPERFVGMHFFNPAHIMKLVEVIRGAKTSQETIDRTVALAKDLKKAPAIAKDVPGFIVNRVARNFYNEALRICTEHAASIEQVDTIMKGAGFKMGPFELMDLIGVDTNFDVTKSMWEQYFYEPRFAPSPMQHQYVEAKLHGRKTSEGFYKYKDNTSK